MRGDGAERAALSKHSIQDVHRNGRGGARKHWVARNDAGGFLGREPECARVVIAPNGAGHTAGVAVIPPVPPSIRGTLTACGGSKRLRRQSLHHHARTTHAHESDPAHLNLLEEALDAAGARRRAPPAVEVPI